MSRSRSLIPSIALAGGLAAGLDTIAMARVPLDEMAVSDSYCHLTDYHDSPGKLDFIRNSDRAQDFAAYARCIGDLARSIEDKAGCVIVTEPVWNSDTDKWDLESYVVCDPVF